MSVEVDGQPIARLRSRKALWLLALLTLRAGKEVERNWLAGMLWPDVDPTQARTNMRPTLSELRSALGPQAVRLDSGGKDTLRLKIEAAEVDIATFDRLVTGELQADWEQAVQLYKGALLQGCEEEWVFQERASREAACIEACLRLSESAISIGNSEAALNHCRRALGINPLSNVAQRILMEALEMSGDRNASLQSYREFANLLRKETGAFPDEKTADLYLKQRKNPEQRVSRPLSPIEYEQPVVGNLPHAFSSLCGREDELEEVLALTKRSRLVMLTGFGGIGKTRLSLEVGRALIGRFPDGVWQIELDSQGEGGPILNLIASTLGLAEQAGQSVSSNVVAHLRSKRLLILLDNCEHVLSDAAQAAEILLKECPEVRILATSRIPLAIKGELVWSVPPLAVPALGHLPQGFTTLNRVLLGYESVRLFLDRAQAVQSSFALTHANALAVAGICSRLEGIPLAIELAAARVKTISVAEIGKRLDDHLGLLTSGSRVTQPRQQTLRSTIDWSYELLDPSERLLLCRLAVFAGGFSLDTAEQVCLRDESTEFNRTTIRLLMQSLADKSLIIPDRRTGRYRMLETLRSYGMEKLRASGEAAEVSIRYREWFYELAIRSEPEFDGAGQEAWAAELRRESGNLRAALDLFADSPDRQLQFVGALSRFWMFKGHYQEGLDSIRQALDRPNAQSPTFERAKALRGGSTMALGRGEVELGRSFLDESLNISRSIGDREGVSLSLCGLGNLASERQEYETAFAFIEEALAIQREVGGKDTVARVLCNLGNVLRRQGKHSAARANLEESLALYREMRDERMITWQLVHMGDIDYHCGSYTSAKSLMEEALQRFRDSDYPRGVAWTQEALARTLVEIDPDASVDTMLEESLSFFLGLSEVSSVALIEFANGQEAIRRGNLLRARELLESCLCTFKDGGNGQREAGTRELLGIVEDQEGNPEAAIQHYRQSLALHQSAGDFLGAASVLEQLTSHVEPILAAQIWGATDSIRLAYDCPIRPSKANAQAKLRANFRKTLGDKVYTAAWNAGAKADSSALIDSLLA